MATLIELQNWRDALQKARATGALTVKHGDTLVTYRTLEEIDKILGGLNQQIADFDGVQRVKLVRIDTRWGC